MGCDRESACVYAPKDDFNPRTRVGCDLTIPGWLNEQADFNPRTRVGCDLKLSVAILIFQISIPATVWGATRRRLHFPPVRKNFNPRTRVGCDEIAEDFVRNLPQFQSTHPRGVRPLKRFKMIFQSYFNPRTRMGCDHSHSFSVAR